MKFSELKKGMKVILRYCHHNLSDSGTIATIVRIPEHFTGQIKILYLSKASQTEVEGTCVISDIEDADAENCARYAAFHKKLAIEFFDQAKKKGYIPQKERKEE